MKNLSFFNKYLNGITARKSIQEMFVKYKATANSFDNKYNTALNDRLVMIITR